MKRNEGREKQEFFENALQGIRLPVLTLDNKWYRLLDEEGRREVKGLEEQLNDLLKRQGKLNTDIRDIKKLKKKLMQEIVTLADEAEQGGGKSLEKKLAENKRLVEECNEKLDDFQDESMELPGEIEKLNLQLMLITMERCYDALRENADEIQEIAQWVTGVRIELKKRLIRKQEMEQRNYDIYSYMNDIFGAEVMDLFDMEFDLEQHRPVPARRTDPE